VKCDETRRVADLYLDCEFEERERVQVEAHLAECEECRDLFRARQAFGEALRRKLTPHRVPAEARRRLTAAAMDASRTRAFFPHRLLSPIPMAAAAVLLVALVTGGVFLLRPSQDEQLGKLVDEAIATHEAFLPPEIVGSAEQIRGFLARQGEADAAPPLKEDGATRLVGARLVRVGNVPAIHYRYLHRGRDVSVVQLPHRFARTLRRAGDALPRADVQQARVLLNEARDGHSVTLYDAPGFTNTVVGDVPQNELLKLIPASL